MNSQPHHNLIIEANRPQRAYWLEMWRYRELFYFLSWRDVLVRYKQTVIGTAWSLLRPLLMMIVLTVVFGKLAKMPSGGVPYPILVLAAMLPWQLFAGALSDSSSSVVANASLISKVYFPRMVIPASSVIVNTVDFAVSLVILVGMMAYYRFSPDWRILVLPGLLTLAMVTALGAGLWTSALNVKYRDFRYVVPFVVQFGMYVSPVGFSSNVVPERWRLIYSANPMVGVIDGFRWAVLRGEASIYWPGFAVSVALATLILSSGVWYFRKAERGFADVI